VLKALKENHLLVNLEKCLFHIKELEFLGHVISGKFIKTDPKKLEAVLSWLEPTTVKQVQSFLGFGNYYRPVYKEFFINSKPALPTKKGIDLD